MTLDGLEEAVRRPVPRRSRVNLVGCADAFIITSKSKRLLRRQIKPVAKDFLAERGPTLLKDKTVITYIKKDFTFLGQTFRKHGRVLHITPSRQRVVALGLKVGMLIRKHVSAPMPVLIKKLNETLRGWANHRRAKTTSGKTTVYEVLKLHAIGIRRYIKIRAALLRGLSRMMGNYHVRVFGEKGVTPLTHPVCQKDI